MMNSIENIQVYQIKRQKEEILITAWQYKIGNKN
jgi:hypothetical protein